MKPPKVKRFSEKDFDVVPKPTRDRPKKPVAVKPPDT